MAAGWAGTGGGGGWQGGAGYRILHLPVHLLKEISFGWLTHLQPLVPGIFQTAVFALSPTFLNSHIALV